MYTHKSNQTLEIIEYVRSSYGIEPDFPFEGDFQTAVFRKRVSGKWFGIIMKVKASVLGLDSDKKIEIINLKATPEHILQLTDSITYFPAYHMNKKHWYTMKLDGSVPTEELCFRVDASFHIVK